MKGHTSPSKFAILKLAGHYKKEWAPGGAQKDSGTCLRGLQAPVPAAAALAAGCSHRAVQQLA